MGRQIAGPHDGRTALGTHPLKASVGADVAVSDEVTSAGEDSRKPARGVAAHSAFYRIEAAVVAKRSADQGQEIRLGACDDLGNVESHLLRDVR